MFPFCKNPKPSKVYCITATAQTKPLWMLFGAETQPESHGKIDKSSSGPANNNILRKSKMPVM